MITKSCGQHDHVITTCQPPPGSTMTTVVTIATITMGAQDADAS